jgi:hypothetical protein
MVWSRQDLVSRLPACPSVFVLAFPCREVGAAMFVQVSSSEQRTMTCKGGPVVKVFFGAGLAHLLFKARLRVGAACLCVRSHLFGIG